MIENMSVDEPLSGARPDHKVCYNLVITEDRGHHSRLTWHLHRMLSIQLALGTQVSEELTTWDVLHEEEKVARVLCEAL